MDKFGSIIDRTNMKLGSKFFNSLRIKTQLFFFFFFWWGLLHGPQQGPDRMKEKNL